MTDLVEDHPFLVLILGKMAYPFMLIAAGMMWSQSESLQNVIPGHLILSFLIVECGAMVLTSLIMRLTLIGAAFSALCCMYILGGVFTVIMSAIEPDSLQYFILLTVVFSAISLPLSFFNLIFDGGHWSIPKLSYIVAGILNAFTATLYILAIRKTWEDYRFPEGDFVIKDKILYDSFLGDIFGAPGGFASASGAVVFYIVLAMICLGAFVATIILRKKLHQITIRFFQSILNS